MESWWNPVGKPREMLVLTIERTNQTTQANSLKSKYADPLKEQPPVVRINPPTLAVKPSSSVDNPLVRNPLCRYHLSGEPLGRAYPSTKMSDLWRHLKTCPNYA